MFPGFSFSRVWFALFVCVALTLFIGVPAGPSFAHCAGNHTGNHPHCTGGGGEDPPPPLPEFDPNFRPEIVSIVHGDGAGIYVADGNGSQPTRVFASGEIEPQTGITLSPDGRDIIFVGVVEVKRRVFDYGLYRMSLYDEDDFAPSPPERVRDGHENSLYWAPEKKSDGIGALVDWILADNVSTDCAQTQWDLFLINLETNQRFNITNTCDKNEYNPTWSPSGDQIAAVTQSPIWTGETDIEILTVDFGGANGPVVGNSVSLLTANAQALVAAGKDGILNPGAPRLDWSVANNQIVVSAVATPGLWIIPPDPEQVAASAIHVPDPPGLRRLDTIWSPDGTQFLLRQSALPDTCARSVLSSELKKNDPAQGYAGQRVIEDVTITPTSATVTCTTDSALENLGHYFDWVSAPPLP